MKVVKKLLAPVLVVGLLLTSLVTLHNLKDTKKNNVFRIGISQYITHKSLDATRKGYRGVEKRRLCRWEKYSDRFPKCSRGATKSEKYFLKQLAEESDLVLVIATLLHKVWLIPLNQHLLSSQL